MSVVVILEAIQWITVAIVFFELIYCVLQKPSEMQKHLIVLLMSTIFMVVGFTLEMNADTFEAAVQSIFLYYIGEPYLLLSILLLFCSFYGLKVPKGVQVALIFAATLFPVLVYTNPLHHLYYADLGFNPEATFSCVVYTHGPLYYLNIAMAIIYFASYVAVIAVGFAKSKSPAKKRLTRYTVSMVLSGIAGFTVYVFNLSGGYDSTILGLAFGVVLIGFLFFRCRIFDIVDAAKNYALDVSDDGLVVFDDCDTVVYENATAAKVLDKAIDRSFVEKLKEDSTTLHSGDQVFNLKVHGMNKGKYYVGKSVEIYDVTETVKNRERLEEAVRETTIQLGKTQREILGSLANIVEARSLETGDHIRRVSEYTEKIARVLQNTIKYENVLTEEVIETMALAAPLHDMGKISISDAILLKPGKLTDEEFEEMKKHSAMGAEVIRKTLAGLENEEFIRMAETIALYHHERFDGKGYPLGLFGDSIPLAARIVALADCYDAMTTERCYKKAFSDEEATEIIKKERGTHFDPDVVDAFLRLQEHREKGLDG